MTTQPSAHASGNIGKAEGELIGIAMVLTAPRRPLEQRRLAWHKPRSGEILLKVHACGVCRTDLHLVDGELPHPKLPVVPGHEVVGRIVAVGDGVEHVQIGERVGVPWLGYACGTCEFCCTARENLRHYTQNEGDVRLRPCVAVGFTAR